MIDRARYSACLEMLFVRESDSFEERIQLAAEAGLEAVEFWRSTDKNLPNVQKALTDTGMKLTGIVAEPMIALTDSRNHHEFLEGFRQSTEVANRLGASFLIAQAGILDDNSSRERQRGDLVEALRRSADILRGSGLRLALEPLNTLVDHRGYFLSSTAEGLDIIDDVNDPQIGLLYDIYHSMVMRESPEEVLTGRIHRVVHVHVADHPGRNEPGSGQLPLRHALHWIDSQGYQGDFGLEFRPTTSTEEALLHTLSYINYKQG